VSRSKRARREAAREREKLRLKRGIAPAPPKPAPKGPNHAQAARRPFDWRSFFITTLIFWGLSLVVIFVVVPQVQTFFGGGQNQATGPTAAPVPTLGPRQTYSAPPPMVIDPARTYYATIETEKGPIRAVLFAQDAPRTVNNFVFLAREGFYNGTTFSRVIKDLMAQGGDPVGDGKGGPGYYLEPEASPHPVVAGALVMAQEEGKVSGSQFFIPYRPMPELDGKYTVFGQVISGLDVLQSLTPRDPQANPAYAGDTIRRIVITEE